MGKQLKHAAPGETLTQRKEAMGMATHVPRAHQLRSKHPPLPTSYTHDPTVAHTHFQELVEQAEDIDLVELVVPEPLLKLTAGLPRSFLPVIIALGTGHSELVC